MKTSLERAREMTSGAALILAIKPETGLELLTEEIAKALDERLVISMPSDSEIISKLLLVINSKRLWYKATANFIGWLRSRMKVSTCRCSND